MPAGVYEGWTLNQPSSDDVPDVNGPASLPPGFNLTEAAMQTKQDAQAQVMERQWKEANRANTLSWDERSSYPGPMSPPNTSADTAYGRIPEQR